MIRSPLRLVVLISGNGSNLQAMIDAIGRGELAAEIAAVFSNRRDAYGLVRAREAGLPAYILPFGPYRAAGGGRAGYDAALAVAVAACRPDLIVLAGWMHVLSAAFLDRFPGRVINLHPALPGQFPGTDAIARAFAAYRRGEIAATGIMVHHVVPELDAGPVLATAAVPIYPADSLEELEARVHATEHRLLVQVIGRLAGEPAPARESENKPHQDRRGDSAMVTPLGRIAVQKDQAAIELARRYPQSVETVWAALTEPAQLAAWFGPVTLEPRAGGTIVVEAGPASVPVAVRRSVGQILAWEPPRLLEYEWRQAIIEASTLRYELVPAGDGTLLKLTHRWLSLPSAKGFIPGQHAYLDRLAAHLAGEPIPDWQQRFNEVAPAYAGAVVEG